MRVVYLILVAIGLPVATKPNPPVTGISTGAAVAAEVLTLAAK